VHATRNGRPPLAPRLRCGGRRRSWRGACAWRRGRWPPPNAGQVRGVAVALSVFTPTVTTLAHAVTAEAESASLSALNAQLSARAGGLAGELQVSQLG
jgi:hypothetical protein